MASGSITSWQIEGERVEIVTDFLFLGSKITADGNCSHEIRRWLIASWWESYDKPRECIKKQRHHFSDKGLYSQFFLVVMYGYESWAIKKVEHWGIDAFELWCWRRLLRVPWKARSNHSIFKEINLEYSLEWLMLKLKLQYFGHLMQTAGSLENTLILRKIEGR